jgi:GNAT superfamily N-acetyltransferase
LIQRKQFEIFRRFLAPTDGFHFRVGGISQMITTANTPAIEIRPAEERDITDLARLAGELGYPSTPEQVRERFAGFRAAPDQATFVAVASGNAVIGWIHLCEARSVESDPRAEITGLVVDSNFRGGGVGRLLVGRGEDWALDRGLEIIGVRSNIIRERTHIFYERLGYAVTKTQKVFRKTLH